MKASKIILTLLILLRTSLARAEEGKFIQNQDTIDYLKQFNDNPKACIMIEALQYTIVGKLTPHAYELAPYAILQTRKGGFVGTGTPRGMMVKYIGSKEIPGKNGFTNLYQFWEECK